MFPENQDDRTRWKNYQATDCKYSFISDIYHATLVVFYIMVIIMISKQYEISGGRHIGD